MSLFFMLFSAAICLLGPVTAAVILIRKLKASWLMFLLGIVVFTSTQYLLRMPLIDELLKTAWFNRFMETQRLLYVVVMALSAGVFEETGRYAAFRLLHRDLLTWENGIVFGFGHGGAEAFATGLYYTEMIAGTLSGKDTVTALSLSQYNLLMGGVERTFAIAVHIGFTLLVMYAVKRRKIWCFILAVFGHGLINTIYMLSRSYADWAADGVFALFAIMTVILTVRIRPALNGTPKKAKAFLG